MYHGPEIISLFAVFLPGFVVLHPFFAANFKFAPRMNASGFFQNFINNALFQSVMAVPATSATAAVMRPPHGQSTDLLLLSKLV